MICKQKVVETWKAGNFPLSSLPVVWKLATVHSFPFYPIIKTSTYKLSFLIHLVLPRASIPFGFTLSLKLLPASYPFKSFRFYPII